MRKSLSRFVIFSFVCAITVAMSPAACAEDWDYVSCVKKDGSYDWASFGYDINNKLLNNNSSIAHESARGYVWLSGIYSGNDDPSIGIRFTLTDGNHPIRVSSADAQAYCDELIQNCKNLGSEYAFVGAGKNHYPIVIKLNDKPGPVNYKICPHKY
jgi:hypothetical protein